MTCINTIGKAILNDCTEVKGKGLEQDAYIIDRSFVDFPSSTKTKNVISVIALYGGKQGYKFHTRSVDGIMGVTDAGKKTTFGTAVDRNFQFVIEAKTATNAEFIDGLREGRYVVIAEKRAKDASITGDQQFIVYGWEQGLTFKDFAQDHNSDDSNGGWVVNLEELNAVSTMLFFASTDYDASKAALEALLVPAVVVP